MDFFNAPEYFISYGSYYKANYLVFFKWNENDEPNLEVDVDIACICACVMCNLYVIHIGF